MALDWRHHKNQRLTTPSAAFNVVAGPGETLESAIVTGAPREHVLIRAFSPPRHDGTHSGV